MAGGPVHPGPRALLFCPLPGCGGCGDGGGSPITNSVLKAHTTDTCTKTLLFRKPLSGPARAECARTLHRVTATWHCYKAQTRSLEVRNEWNSTLPRNV